MYYPQAPGNFFPQPQARDYSRLLKNAHYFVGLLLTPVALALFIVLALNWPHEGTIPKLLSSLLFFLVCFVSLGWYPFYLGIWNLIVGCLLFIKPSAVRDLAQKEMAYTWPWQTLSLWELAMGHFLASVCYFAQDGILSLWIVVFFPHSSFFFLAGAGALILLMIVGLVLIHLASKRRAARGAPL